MCEFGYASLLVCFAKSMWTCITLGCNKNTSFKYVDLHVCLSMLTCITNVCSMLKNQTHVEQEHSWVMHVNVIIPVYPVKFCCTCQSRIKCKVGSLIAQCMPFSSIHNMESIFSWQKVSYCNVSRQFATKRSTFTNLKQKCHIKQNCMLHREPKTERDLLLRGDKFNQTLCMWRKWQIWGTAEMLKQNWSQVLDYNVPPPPTPILMKTKCLS